MHVSHPSIGLVLRLLRQLATSQDEKRPGAFPSSDRRWSSTPSIQSGGTFCDANSQGPGSPSPQSRPSPKPCLLILRRGGTSGIRVAQ